MSFTPVPCVEPRVLRPWPVWRSRALRPWTPTRTFGPGPDPLFFASPKKRGEKKGDPALRSPLPACGREGFPALLRTRGSRRTRCARLRLAPLRQAARSQITRRACGALPRVLALLGGAEGEWGPKQPTANTNTRMQSASRGPAIGCLAVPFPSAPPSSTEDRPACRRHASPLARPACLSGASRRRAQRVLAGAGLRAAQGTSLGRRPREASAVGSPFFSPLFFGEAKKRGSGPGPKVLVGVQGRSALGLGLLGVQERSALVRGPGGGSPLGAATLARRTRVGPAP